MADDKMNNAGFSPNSQECTLWEMTDHLEIDNKPKEKGDGGKASKDPLEQKMRQGVGSEQELPANNTPDYHPGDLLLDTYRVEDDLIEGGMGVVWRVHHTGWNVDLAMKRPKAGVFSTEDQKKRFTDECTNWINLGLHPNIVSCYYVREIDGTPTIFSEWMDNGSLEDCIKHKTLYDGTPEEVQKRLLDIAIQTARGLHYAHKKMIHRDVKPGNLLLNKDWTAKVSDFGLTKAKSMLTFLDGTATKLESYEGVAMLSSSDVMSPPYCSPEQASAQLLTIRTDIYSWAVSVLEMYLGDKPWAHGRDPSGPVVGQQYRYYFNKCVDRPVPKALQELLAKCLVLDPDDRPEDFAVVESELKRIYLEKTGSPYPRSEPDTASDTAESLNNRALSFLDLGMNDEAEELFKEAIEKDGSRFLYHYNYALYCWNQHRISDRTLMEYLDRNRDSSDLCKKKMEILLNMRGGCIELSMKYLALSFILKSNWLDWDKDGILYTYNDSRPEDLEPLFEPSAISVDGKYRVIGYEEKDDQKIIHYGYRIENLDTGEIREYPIEYDDYKESMDSIVYHLYAFFIGPENHLYAFFIGPESELVVVQRGVLWIFESRTGRLVRSMPPVPSERLDWMCCYYIIGYTQSGVIEYGLSEHIGIKARRMHIDNTLSYEISEFSITNMRLDAEKKLVSNYEEALSCWNRDDVAGTYRALNRSFEEQVITMHEPSLKLWSELRKYYETDSLVTVVPTQDAPTPLPIRNECEKNQRYQDKLISSSVWNKIKWDDGQTAFSIIDDSIREYNSYMHCYEDRYYYKFYATDIRSGNSYYIIKYLEAESKADYEKIWAAHNCLYMEGDHKLWYITVHGRRMIDFAEMSRKSDGRVSFTLPGEYSLKNTKEGVDIGGFVFDDIFTDFRPLWDSDVIACRDNNYRLVYRYKEKE